MTDATHPFDALMEITARPPVVFVRGAGSYLWDDSRKRYLDFVQGWAVNCARPFAACHCRSARRAIKTAADAEPCFLQRAQPEAGAALVENTCFDHVYFPNSGAEANEGALKLARKWGKEKKNGAFEIICAENAFHGRTLQPRSGTERTKRRSRRCPKGFLHGRSTTSRR